MIACLRALLGLTIGGLAVAAAMSFGMVQGTALPAQLRVLAAAAVAVAKPVTQPAPAVAAVPAVPSSSPSVPSSLAAQVPAPLAVPQASVAALQAIPAAAPPRMPVVSYPDAALLGDQATAIRARDGHFYFDAAINGVLVRMLFDTGATDIALRAEDAGKAGIDVASLQYTVAVSTANGRSSAAPVLISSLTIGDITRRNVRALVSRPGAMSTNLLGQSFMSRISGYKVDGERLILQGGR